MFNGKKTIQMGFIARNTTTNIVHYSKGANKLADLIGCNYSTITKYYQLNINKGKDKTIGSWIVSKTNDLNNNKRGLNINSLFNGKNTI
jgi:hypothetical protein